MPAKPTIKQAKAMELIREGKTPTQAMREAGYSENTSEAPGQNLLRSAGAKNIIEAYREEYVRQGLIPASYIQKVIELTEAEKVHSSHTEPDTLVPDWQARAKGLEIYRKDIGLDQEQPVVIPVGEMTINFS